MPDSNAIPDETAYFRTNLPPLDLDLISNQASAFISRHAATNRPLVLVTSGGTSVPLETNMVRFIDNFSAGTRGAASAEVFLARGYAVLFLHREYSLLPYSRNLVANNGILDYLARDTSNGHVKIKDEHKQGITKSLELYTHARDQGTLLMLSFTTINEYLWKLKTIATLMRSLESNALFYLAAAVSDFFIPSDRMVEHKIQSTEAFVEQNRTHNAGVNPAARIDAGKLVIHLDPVPKFLKQLVDGWAPQGMIVSFKLETDPAILVQKARYALDRYSHHLVIGNLLSTRKWEVVLVSAKGEDWVRLPGGKESVERGDAVEIETLIVPEVQRLHNEHIAVFKRSERM